MQVFLGVLHLHIKWGFNNPPHPKKSPSNNTVFFHPLYEYRTYCIFLQSSYPVVIAHTHRQTVRTRAKIGSATIYYAEKGVPFVSITMPLRRNAVEATQLCYHDVRSIVTHSFDRIVFRGTQRSYRSIYPKRVARRESAVVTKAQRDGGLLNFFFILFFYFSCVDYISLLLARRLVVPLLTYRAHAI